MSGTIPNPVKIYHIVHIDKLPSILHDGFLLCDAEMQRRQPVGTTIGMNKIKTRRLEKQLSSYPDLHVGDCVPFYFCPRPVMLYMFYRDDHPEISYHGGQAPIIHLVADIQQAVRWAEQNDKHYVFTSLNAGSSVFEEYTDLADLNSLKWEVITSNYWQGEREHKQAEFLMELQFPWNLIETIGVYSKQQYDRVVEILSGTDYRPQIVIKRDWYY